MNIYFFIMDSLVEILIPLVLILLLSMLVYLVVKLFLDNVKEIRKKKNYCDKAELEEDDENIIQRAIIMLGNEKIEVEVDCYEIDYTTIKIEGKDGELYLTDIKNVLLSRLERIE